MPYKVVRRPIEGKIAKKEEGKTNGIEVCSVAAFER